MLIKTFCGENFDMKARIVIWNNVSLSREHVLQALGWTLTPGIIPFTASAFKLAVWHATPLSSSHAVHLLVSSLDALPEE